MKDLRDFGTEKHPVHPSGIRSLLECPWRAVMSFLEPADGESGEAGDTGSVMHLGAAAMHRGGSPAECLEAMAQGKSKHPAADVTDAMDLYFRYSRDVRNRGVETALVEAPIAFSIKASPDDPTGEPVSIIGTLDQVRKVGGRYFYWDIKTTKKDPLRMLSLYALQAAAYCIGGSIRLGVKVEPGGCIFPRRYAQDGSGPAHYHFAWTFEDIELLLEPLRRKVADIRSGRVHHMPNENCGYCSARTPDVCFPKLKRTALPILPHPAVEVLKLYPGRSVSEETHNSWLALRDKLLV